MKHKRKKGKKGNTVKLASVRVRWSKHETALLIHTYLSIKEGTVARKEAVSYLSDVLRRHAIEQMLQVDDKYRNENGIAMQLANIQQLLQDEAGSRRHNAAVFIELVDLYNNDPAQYEAILADAKAEYKWEDYNCKIEENPASAVNDAFKQSDGVAEYMSGQNLEYIDLRQKGGCLWVIGGPEISEKLEPMRAKDVTFHFKKGGGNATQGRDSWWSKDYPKTDDLLETEPSSSARESSIEDDLIHKTIKSILNDNFRYGFNIESPIELIRFRNCCDKKSQPIVGGLDDVELNSAIRECGIEIDSKIYVINDSDRAEIVRHINTCVAEGMKLFYYEQFYERNEDWLFNAHVYDAQILKAILMAYCPEHQYKKHYFITDDHVHNENQALNCEILRIWGDRTLRTYSELAQLLKYVPIDKIKYTLSSNELFVWNSPETYTRKDHFTITKEWRDNIEQFAKKCCEETGSVTFEQLPLEEVAAENYELSETALYDIVFSYISKHFSRNGRVIRLQEDRIDATTMIQEYCRQRDACTVDQLKEVMKEAEGVVRYPTIIEAANSIMVRISENRFINEKQIHFDVESIDKILDSIIEHNAIGIQDITTFATFPECGVPWNLFVLESYCRRFSKSFRYDCITPNSKNSGAIIRKSSDLTYQDAMAELLAKSAVELDSQNAFDFLIDSGLLIRRRYSEMSMLLDKASDIRKGSEQ